MMRFISSTLLTGRSPHALAATIAAIAVIVGMSPLTTTEAHAETYSSLISGPITIPDGPAAGVSSTITVSDNFTLASFNSITITGLNHAFLGDLIATLTHNGVSVDIFDRVLGGPDRNPGFGSYSDLSGSYTFALGGADFNAAAVVADTGIIPSNVTYAPYAGEGVTGRIGDGDAGGSSPFTQTFANFALTSVQGAWTLNISDRSHPTTGSFTGWSFNVTPQAATPTAAPEPGSLTLLLPIMGAIGMAVLVAQRRRNLQ
jgi:subtilisin-like proprotein convertase family protein